MALHIKTLKKDKSILDKQRHINIIDSLKTSDTNAKMHRLG